jgi:type I restriction enzyme S subunit
MLEGPYKLPEGWRWVRLAEVALDIQTGFAFRKKNAQRGDILQFRPYNIGNDGELDLRQQFLVPREVLPANWSPLEPGDVLFNNTNSVELIGKTALVRERMEVAFSNHITRIRVRPDLCEGAWLALTLNALWRQGFFAQRCNRWIGQAGYNTESLRETLIPLPPLSAQRRIGARIEELMERVREARRLRQAAREEAERLWQSVLADTFPRPGSDLPEGWRWVRLGEIFDLQQGASMSPKRRIGSNPKPFLRTKNVLWGTIDLSSVDEMDFTDEEVEKLRLQPGDLLVCEGGDVGRTAIWEGQLPLVLYQNHIHRLRARDDSIEPRFTLYWMQAAYQVFLAYQGTESRTAIPNLSGYRLKQFLAPLPPLAEQRRIEAHLEGVQEKIRALRAAQAETDEALRRLEQAILDKAFRGEL